MSAPLFSIIVPTFNSGAKVAFTAASVLSQEAGLCELLVIDGNSTDDTLAHLRALDASVRWFSEPDSGIYDAMNKGIAMAKGQFLLFLGAGDQLRPGVLQKVAKVLLSKHEDLLLYGDVYRCDTKLVYGGAFSKLRFLSENICHQSIFYHRSIFERIGRYDLRFPTCADHEFNIRCFGHSDIRKTYFTLVIADFEGAGISCAAPDRVFLREWPGLIRRNFGVLYYACFILCHSRASRLAWGFLRLVRRLGAPRQASLIEVRDAPLTQPVPACRPANTPES